jgi:hypothetical protein
LAGTVGGDWDLERAFALDGAIKHRAIAQRYRDGARWEETDLFREAYARRLAAGEPVRGAATMRELLDQYYTRVDGMFDDMKARGFVFRDGRHHHPLPTLLLGRGEIFIGNQGNHRLAMAQVLGLDRFAGKVICRHPSALPPG